MKILLLLMVILISLVLGCEYSPDINTPREMEPVNESDAVGMSGFTFSIYNHSYKLNMFIVKNRFTCSVDNDGNIPMVSFAIEFQDPGPAAINDVNSIFMRAKSLPADGNYHTLSYNPVDRDALFASKILLYYDNGGYFEIIPGKQSGDTDNFMIKIYPSGNEHKLNGDFYYNIIDGGINLEIKGYFEVKY